MNLNRSALIAYTTPLTEFGLVLQSQIDELTRRAVYMGTRHCVGPPTNRMRLAIKARALRAIRSVSVGDF